jgi:hypothetical protein
MGREREQEKHSKRAEHGQDTVANLALHTFAGRGFNGLGHKLNDTR